MPLLGNAKDSQMNNDSTLALRFAHSSESRRESALCEVKPRIRKHDMHYDLALVLLFCKNMTAPPSRPQRMLKYETCQNKACVGLIFSRGVLGALRFTSCARQPFWKSLWKLLLTEAEEWFSAKFV